MNKSSLQVVSLRIVDAALQQFDTTPINDVPELLREPLQTYRDLVQRRADLENELKGIE